MKASEFLYQLDRAIQEQGDCEVHVAMEKADADNWGEYNPLTSFDLRIVVEGGWINLVAENGTRIPRQPHERE